MPGMLSATCVFACDVLQLLQVLALVDQRASLAEYYMHPTSSDQNRSHMGQIKRVGHVVAQAFKYTIEKKVRYAFISTYRATW